MAVLRKGQEAGYSLRHILTEALLVLEASAEEEQAVMVAISEVAVRLAQVQSVLERFQHVGLAPVQPQAGKPEQEGLAESFLLSVRSAAKPGLGLNS